MLYDITLKIRYEYDNAADVSRHIVRLMPADLPGEQRLVAGALTVHPHPDEWINRTDFFGNPFVELAFLHAFEEIGFKVQSRVSRVGPGARLDVSPGLADLARDLNGHHSVDALSPHHFKGSSLRVPLHPATAAYGRACLQGEPSVVQAVTQIGNALRRDMTYDPKATKVDTPMIEAFNGRRGVCQDFSHIMISALRGIGIPAGYVSGFLRTRPPPGKARLEGADAMHAWVRAWCGKDMGWVEYDPTNGVGAGPDHVVVARGRDYADVAPVRGVMRTSGEHRSEQAVDVVPVGQTEGA